MNEIKCLFFISLYFHCKKLFFTAAVKHIFTYFHWSSAGQISFNIQINKYNMSDQHFIITLNYSK